MGLPSLGKMVLDPFPDQTSFLLAVDDTSLVVPVKVPAASEPVSEDCPLDQVLALSSTQNIVQSEGQQVVIFTVNFRQGNIFPHNLHL